MNETIIDLPTIVTRSSAEFYQIQDACGQGGIIVIHAQDGSLTVRAGTVFGEFSHKWPWDGGDPKPFLVSMQRDYALRCLTLESPAGPYGKRNALKFWSEIWLPFTKALSQELAA